MHVFRYSHAYNITDNGVNNVVSNKLGHCDVDKIPGYMFIK